MITNEPTLRKRPIDIEIKHYRSPYRLQCEQQAYRIVPYNMPLLFQVT